MNFLSLRFLSHRRAARNEECGNSKSALIDKETQRIFSSLEEKFIRFNYDPRTENDLRMQFRELVRIPWITHIAFQMNMLLIGFSHVYLHGPYGKEYDIGSFLAQFDRDNGTVLFENVTRRVLTENGRLLHHPHINSDGKLCMVDGEIQLKGSIRNGNTLDAVNIIHDILHTYDPRSPYGRISIWPEHEGHHES